MSSSEPTGSIRRLLGWDYTTGYGSFDIALVDTALNAAGYTAPIGCVPPNQMPAPTAALTATNNVGVAPLTVAFDASASTDPQAARSQITALITAMEQSPSKTLPIFRRTPTLRPELKPYRCK